MRNWNTRAADATAVQLPAGQCPRAGIALNSANDPLITFLALDSNMPHAAAKLSLGLDFTLTPEQQAEQLAWLEAELKRPRMTPFLGVIAHHPVYSDGPHGDHPVLIRDWDPSSASVEWTFTWRATTTTRSTWMFEGHPTSHFLSGAEGRICTRSRLILRSAGPMRRRFTALAVSR